MTYMNIDYEAKNTLLLTLSHLLEKPNKGTLGDFLDLVDEYNEISDDLSSDIAAIIKTCQKIPRDANREAILKEARKAYDALRELQM